MSTERLRQIKRAFVIGILAEGALFLLNLSFSDTAVQEMPWLAGLQNPVGVLISWAMLHAAVRHFAAQFPPMAFVRAVQLLAFTIQTLVFSIEALFVIVVFEHFYGGRVLSG